MTYRALYLAAKKELAAAGVDTPGTDALLLTEHFFGLDRAGLALHGEETPSPEKEALFGQAVSQRCARRPLAYILGSWEFMGLSLAVGEGVLCPREDTAVLVETAASFLRECPSPRGVDLCAGTGAVALGLCSLLPRASVSCLEISDAALFYLKKNLAAHPAYDVQAKKGDILLAETALGYPEKSLDFVVSNPPYIPRAQLPALQAEVRQEPALALDGGEDGLDFYRALLPLWLPRLKPGGLIAVEIGEDQGPAVTALFAAYGLHGITLRQDLSGWDRCAAALV